MSATWLAQWPAFLAGLALLILPGLPAALLLRLRGAFLLAGSVVCSLASIGGASLIAPVMGVRWSVLPVVLVAVVTAAIAAVLRVVSRGRAVAVSSGASRWAWAALGAAVVVWGLVILLGIKSPSHPTQLYDGLFHLNAVEFILQKGDASPFHMTMALGDTKTTFYPTLWHAVVSLVVPVASSVVAATNVVTVVVIALVWPVALATLARALFPKRPAAAIWTPLLALGFTVFPLGFLNWGVLYPNLIGTIQIPLVLAFVILIGRSGLTRPQRIAIALLSLATAASTALGHPSALLGAVALLIPYAAWRAYEFAGARRRRDRWFVALLGVVCLAVLGIVWNNANVTTNEWLPGVTLAQAFGEAAFLGPVGRATGLLLGALSIAGISAVVRQRRWWILASHGVALAFYLAAAWLPVLYLRSAIVGVWYDDTTRVAALLAMIGLPLAGLGAAEVVAWGRGLHRSGHSRKALALIAVLVVLAATHLTAVRDDLSFMRNVSFRFDDESRGLSAEEAQLFDEADEILDEDDLVLGNPLTGAALLYAYTGHDVVFPHVTGRYSTSAQILARSLNLGEPPACDALEDVGVTYVLDFGDRELFENHYTTYGGLHDLSDLPFLTEAARVGDAVLYEVSGC